MADITMSDGRRPARGHAAFAAQARRTLGVTSDAHALRDVPVPLAHTALGIAACAVAFLVRVPALGLRSGVIGSTAVAVGIAAGLLLYDRLVHPEEPGTGIDATVLPAAAIGAFSIVLAASTSWVVRIGAAGASALVIGGVPYIGEVALTRRRTPPLRLARDLAGLAIAVPFLFAAVSTDRLALASRVALVTVGLALVAFDGLRIDAVSWRVALGGAIVAGVGAGVATIVAPVTYGQGYVAAMILVVWYGIRGIANSFGAGRRGVLLVLENVAVVIVALLALAWVGAR